MKKLTSTVITAASAVSLAAILCLSACGGSASKYTQGNYILETTSAAQISNSGHSYDSGKYDYDAVYETEDDSYFNYTEDLFGSEQGFGYEVAEKDTGESIVTADLTSTDSMKKLVYTCSIDLETTDYDATVRAIRESITACGGFIESENQYDNAWNWYFSNYEKTSGTLSCYLVIRIPTAQYDSFLSGLENNGKITSKNQNVENITRRYNDTATTIHSLEIQEERLLDMMSQAETIEDMLAIEDRLSEVQNELALYRSNLSEMDTDVAYSTINIDITEVLEYSEPVEPVKTSTFLDRLMNTLRETKDSFLTFLEDFLFVIIRTAPVLLFLGALGGLIAFIIVKSAIARRKRLANKNRTAAAKTETIDVTAGSVAEVTRDSETEA